jgi:hypothetical protein
MEQRPTIVPQVQHLPSMTLSARRRAAAMLAFIQEARRRSCAARSRRVLRLQRLQLQDSS